MSIRRVSHCSHWGAYTILVEDDRIVGVEPSPHDPYPSPIIHSVRNWADPARRVLAPMVREGWLRHRDGSDTTRRGTDRFVEVSWDDVSELVATEIDRVRTEFGNRSIFAGSYGWASSGRFHHPSTLLKRTLNLVGGFTGHVDTYSYAAGPVILKHVLGSDDALKGKASTLDTIAENTETLLVFGSLSAKTAQNEAGGITRRSFETSLREIVERSIKIIHFSPLRDDMPAWANAEWIPVRPNTDTAVLLAIACEIVNADEHDKAFLARHCSGSETLLAYLAGKTDGIVKDATWAARIADVDPDVLVKCARLAVSSRCMITMSWSLQRAHHGEQPYWAGIALASIAGQIGLPGGGIGFGYGSTAGIGGPIGIGTNPAIKAGKAALDSFIPVARIADMLLQPGAEYSYRGERRTYPDARLVYWAGGNPFHHHQDLNRLQQAWTRPETIIVQDPYFTATAKRADIVLPASTSIERNDMAANSHSEFVVAMQQAIRPLGKARSDFDIFRDISSRFGVEHGFAEGRDEMAWLRHLYEMARAANLAQHDFEMPDFDEFWQRGWTEMPVKRNFTYLEDYRADPQSNPLQTESGRIVLGSLELERLNYDSCKAHAAWLEPAEWLGRQSTGDLFHLLSHQPAGRLHSQVETEDSRKARKQGRETAILSPADAERLTITEGQTIRLWNTRGACLATASISLNVRRGVVVLPTGAWFMPVADGMDISGNPNILTPDIPTSEFGQGCAAHTCLVSVERYEGSADDAAIRYASDLASLTASESNSGERA
jgi:biotin/methionine sulfoxide reductase